MPFTKQTHCKQGHEYVEGSFYVATHKSDGRQYRQCRICHRADQAQRYYAMTPEERAIRRKKFPSHAKRPHYQRKHKYGITVSEIEAMLERQGGGCGICDRPLSLGAVEKNAQVSVDHNHETGEIRALLCQGCNAGLGMFGEDERTLRHALAYVMMANYAKGVAA